LTSSARSSLARPVGLPERTLGWTVLEWTVEYLRQPDGPEAGQPWRFTPEQVRIVLWWYAVDPAAGSCTGVESSAGALGKIA